MAERFDIDVSYREGCGCDLQVHRCREHSDDVVDRADAQRAADWIMGLRPGTYPEDVEWGKALDRVVRELRGVRAADEPDSETPFVDESDDDWREWAYEADGDGW